MSKNEQMDGKLEALKGVDRVILLKSVIEYNSSDLLSKEFEDK